MKVKKILLTLGIVLLGIINYSNADINYNNCVLSNISAGLSTNNSDKLGALRQSTKDGAYYLGVFDKGEISSSYGGIEKKILAVNSNTLFWRDENGLPYFFRNQSNQGNFSYYYYCDEITTYGYIPSLSCGQQSYGLSGGNIDFLINFFSTLNDDDFFSYNKDHRGGGINYCFSSHEIGHSICFDYSSSANTECPLLNNKNYGQLTFSNIDTNLLFDGPGFMSSGGGEINTGNIETSTGQRACPFIMYNITLYGKDYTTDLCWSDGTTTSGGEQIQTGYVNIFTAYPTYQDYLNSFNTYQTYCYSSSPRYDRQDCINNLQALPYGRGGATITRNAIKRALPPKKVYQYCRLQTHFTEDQKRGSGLCQFTDQEKYAPGLLSGATTEEELNQLKEEANGNPIEGMADGLLTFGDDGTYITPEDGSIFDDILPDGIISWKELININFVGNLTQIIAKLLVLFKTRPIVDGILPPVILSLLLLIVLFKMYKK